MQHRNWEYAFQKALDTLLASQKVDFEALIEVVWRYGILDRIAPEDSEILLARLTLGNLVFSGGRNDPELYIRIVYSCGQIAEAVKNNQEICGGYCLAAYRAGFFLVMRRKDFEQEVIFRILDRVKEKANLELKKLGLGPLSSFAIGTMGFFNGIQVVITKILSDGRVVLKAYDDNDLLELKRHLDSKNAVSPTELHSSVFIVHS